MQFFYYQLSLLSMIYGDNLSVVEKQSIFRKVSRKVTILNINKKMYCVISRLGADFCCSECTVFYVKIDVGISSNAIGGETKKRLRDWDYK